VVAFSMRRLRDWLRDWIRDWLRDWLCDWLRDCPKGRSW
jgi:hypothetical protein